MEGATLLKRSEFGAEIASCSSLAVFAHHQKPCVGFAGAGFVYSRHK
jgi:hypothetical protein